MSTFTRAKEFRTIILQPALEVLHHMAIPYSPEAERMLLTIALQETALKSRYQLIGGVKAGPARGWWQFEKNGGVAGVMRHRRSKDLAKRWVDRCWVQWHKDPIHRALEGHDELAVGFARFLLWTSPRRLPQSSSEGWEEYLSLWRPGKPHPRSWSGYWKIADEIIFGGR